MKPHRRRATSVLAAAATVLLVAAPATSASALDSNVGTAGHLGAFLSTCSGTTASPDTVTLTAAITASTTVFTVATGCVVTLDLAGFALEVRSISVGLGAHLTIDNSGSTGYLTANASSSDVVAGIRVLTGATLTLKADATTALGGRNAAGIANSSAGTIVIDGDDTTAIGGDQISSFVQGGAGIGSDGPGGAGTITINGDRTTAVGASGGAGIGTGGQGIGGFITINGDNTVAVSSGHHAAGIGGGIQGGVDSIVINGDETSATGSGSGAGIGGGSQGDSVYIKIAGDDTIATAQAGGWGGAGIGGGGTANGGIIVFEGVGTQAIGSDFGAGIGGGDRGDGGTITFVAGSSTTAIASATNRMAAAIGGGWGGSSATGAGDGAVVDIESGATVTATGGATVVGHGHIDSSPIDPSAVGDFGSLTVAGALRIPNSTDELRIPDSNAGAEVIVTSTGVIAGSAATPTDGAQLVGLTGSEGQVDNSGVIALATNLVTGGSPDIDGVWGNHYRLTFDTTAASSTPDPADVTVFAPNVGVGERTMPADPAPPSGQVFDGWFTLSPAQQVTTSTSLASLPGGSSSDGDPVLILLEAHFATPVPPSSGGGANGVSGFVRAPSGPDNGVATPTPSATPIPTPETTPDPEPDSEPAPDETPDPTTGSTDETLLWPWLLGGGVAAALLILLAILLLRRRA